MYIIFDTETTGLPKNFNAPLSDSANWPRMVQLAWQIHNEAGDLVDNQDYIIKPEGYDIPYNASRIHGITTAVAEKKGRDLTGVLLEFCEAVRGCKIGVGQNIDFDYKIVGAELYRKSIENILDPLKQADTMLLGTEYAGIINPKTGKYKPPKLEELYQKLFGHKFDEAHNAAADVNATARVFFEMLRLGIITARDLGLDEAVIKSFRENHPEVISLFPIEIRSQVTEFKRNKKEEHGTTPEIEIGQYFNFHNHSIFSSLQASSHLSDFIDSALENNFPAVGLVDFGNMMGVFKFISEVEKANIALRKKYEEESTRGDNQNVPPEKFPGLVPVVGCEFYISDRPTQKQFTKEDPDRRTNVVLLAKNFNGYKNLAKLSSLGYLEGYYFGVPRISKQQIKEYKKGLVALTSGLSGDVPSTILEFGETRGEEVFKWWKETFGDDFYVQIQNHGIEEEVYINAVLADLAKKYEVKILAQNETYYTRETDAHIQDILLCIKDGEKLSSPVGEGFGKRKGLKSRQFYLKNKKELKETFKNYPYAFEAYEEFLKKFEPYTLTREVLLPKFLIPKEFQDPEDEKDGGKRGENAYLRHLTYEGAKVKFKEMTPEIRERLDFELETIANTGYPGYFLIVQDFCNEARKMDVWVGPGRGSAAGSAVAYCIGITNVDPIEYDLLFERFLNPERISMPDIDIDFDDEGRDKVIKWVIEKYGKMNVAQIITYSILGGKSAITDVGRVMELSIPETKNIAKLVPSSPGMNIAKSLSKYEKLPPEDKVLVDEIKSILENPQDSRFSVLSAAQKMEGCIRNTGIHACGVIITPEDISRLVPITIASKDADILVSQYDNSVAENAGLLKMDFLGLRTLSIIKSAIKLIKERHGKEIDPDKISLHDEKTYKLFQEGKTIGIFQYESLGMQKYMRELKPTVFADLIAMNALYRPGPIQYIPNFINRKHGIEEIVYDLEECKEYLEETYGITVYQEQVMLLSQKLANFTKGEADTLRKAMGKKQIDVLNKMYPKFIEGGKKNNLNEEKLEKIWNDWKAFAEYAFNKSHSTCYAKIAYQTAFLKANYPAEYMASVMTHNLNNTKQITLFMEDCKNLGIDVLGPNVNESTYVFSVNNKGQIRFGLGAIKGIGEGPSEVIVNEVKKGKFRDVYDFFERIPYSQINKRVVESLIVAGAFDEVDNFHRAQYFEPDGLGKTAIEKLLRYGQSFQESKSELERSLFADFAEEVRIERPKISPSPQWPNMFKLNKEKEIIGFYISAHPLDEFKIEYSFVEGKLSKKEVLAEKNVEKRESLAAEIKVEAENVSLENDEQDVMDMDTENTGVLLEKDSREVEAKGPFRFLSLDKIDTFREQVFGPDQLRRFGEMKNYQDRQSLNQSVKENMVAGLITEFTVREGRNSGEKLAFVTMEDYSGSYTFRLGDKDYLKLREKIDLNRFLIFRIKFSLSKDHRIFLNVSDVIELKEVFEKYASSLTIVKDIKEIRQQDIDQLKEVLKNNKGDQNLFFHFKNQEDKSFMEVKSLKSNIKIKADLIKKLSEEFRYTIFLN
ncbi:MAG: DNA polymerase III subunit alpha [Bergeyella sp.]|nr:DNA polymerase III subunit alpha [Bergeyella sp.]